MKISFPKSDPNPKSDPKKLDYCHVDGFEVYKIGHKWHGRDFNISFSANSKKEILTLIKNKSGKNPGNGA